MTTATSDNLSSAAGTRSVPPARRQGQGHGQGQCQSALVRAASPREMGRSTTAVPAITPGPVQGPVQVQAQTPVAGAEAPVGPPLRNPERSERSARRHLMRALLVVGGLVSVGLAWLGAIVPGLPTTIFLIIAVGCFSRSCPWLEDRLIRNRFFRPYLKYIDGDHPMPMKARIIALIMMWTMSLVSCGLILFVSDTAPWWAAALTIALAIAGTIAILRWRRTPRVTNTAPDRA